MAQPTIGAFDPQVIKTQEAGLSANTTNRDATTQLPIGGLLALAMTGFVAIMTETAPAGLLPQIGSGLGVSDTAAGQLVTAYAAGSLLAAIPLVASTLGWRRRRVLLLALSGLLIFNTVTTVSPFYSLTLVARFLAGVSTGLAWGIIAGYARRMVPDPLQGRALAVAMIGTPLALSLGVPAGTLLGSLVGWRLTFAALSMLALGLIVWVLGSLPDLPGQAADQQPSIRAVFLAPGIRSVLFVIVAWMLAHNVLYTYIAPFVERAGLGGRVDLVLLVFGLAALIGIWLTGWLVDRFLRMSVLMSLTVFALVALTLVVGGRLPAIVYPAVAVWGLTFGGAATLLVTAGADAAQNGVDVAQAMNTTAWNIAIAGGSAVGGVLLARFGPGSLLWAVLAALALALLTAWCARHHGFPPGPRQPGRPARISGPEHASQSAKETI